MPKSKTANPPNELALKIKERQAFIEKVIEFVEDILVKRGEILSYQEHSCHTSIKRELLNFCGFSFYSYGSYTMYGGDEIKIWYHPDSLERPVEPVLHVEWWDIKDCKVKIFDSSGTWRIAIKKLLVNRDRAIARADRAKAAREKKAKAKKEKEDLARATANTLQKDAARLGL